MLKKIFGLIVGAIAVIVGLTFFMVAFSVILAVALLVWAYFWWKGGKLRATVHTSRRGTVIDGEGRVIHEETMRNSYVIQDLPAPATQESPPAPDNPPGMP